MNLKTTQLLLGVLLLTIGSLPLQAQTNTPAPSKFEIKKDTDADGVKNKKDKCPSTPPGVFVDGTGCPLDTDKDGVMDYLDKCPDIAGTMELNGCQDKDKDGVSDMDDVCADVPGQLRFKGCPDSDGDGIEDSKDKCPNAKGKDMFMGCPDTDGDGVQDSNDKCPSTATGVKVDLTGCAADADGDGVTDGNDKCPNTKLGVKVDAMGCTADTDGDGVLDIDDKCPGVIGDAANFGCLPVKKEIPKRLRFAMRKINYESGSTVLKTASYPMLDELVNILTEYPDYNLRISAHADGYEKNPSTVSQSRLDAIKSYLLSKNIAESRMTTAGYGKTRPVTSNANATARAQNRRVELELYIR